MKSKRFVKFIIPLACIAIALYMVLTVSVAPQAKEIQPLSTQSDVVNDRVVGSSSDIFGQRYSSQHAPCYGRFDGDRVRSTTSTLLSP